MAKGEWELLDIIEIYPVLTMRASFYDGQFGENQGNFSRIKNYARFEKQMDLSPLPEDEEVDIIFWVADTEKMVIRPLRQSLRFNRKELEPGSWLHKSK